MDFRRFKTPFHGRKSGRLMLKLEDVSGEAWMDVAPTGQTWRTLDNLKPPDASLDTRHRHNRRSPIHIMPLVYPISYILLSYTDGKDGDMSNIDGIYISIKNRSYK